MSTPTSIAIGTGSRKLIKNACERNGVTQRQVLDEFAMLYSLTTYLDKIEQDRIILASLPEGDERTAWVRSELWAEWKTWQALAERAVEKGSCCKAMRGMWAEFNAKMYELMSEPA